MSETITDDFIAVLTYKTEKQGGRSTPAYSGYRPGIKFPFSDMQTSGRQTFIDKSIVNPGDVVKASIKIVSTDYFKHTLEEGLEFDFREGKTIIGTGIIVEILNPVLKKL